MTHFRFLSQRDRSSDSLSLFESEVTGPVTHFRFLSHGDSNSVCLVLSRIYYESEGLMHLLINATR